MAPNYDDIRSLPRVETQPQPVSPVLPSLV